MTVETVESLPALLPFHTLGSPFPRHASDTERADGTLRAVFSWQPPVTGSSTGTGATLHARGPGKTDLSVATVGAMQTRGAGGADDWLDVVDTVGVSFVHLLNLCCDRRDIIRNGLLQLFLCQINGRLVVRLLLQRRVQLFQVLCELSLCLHHWFRQRRRLICVRNPGGKQQRSRGHR